MTTIWKYVLGPATTLDMPQGAKVLAVHTQKGIPVLWALVDSDAPKERRFFRVFGTGHAIAPQFQIPYLPWLRDPGYLGTFQLDQGSLIYHAFEVFPKNEEGL